MPLLKQDIRSPMQTGKTTMLLALASGYSLQNIPGVIVARTEEAAQVFKKRHATPFDVLGPNEFVRDLRRTRSCSPKYRVFLLDDSDLMSSSEGHPATLLEHHFKDTSDYIVVVSFYTDEQTKSPVLMSRENPNGWKLESLIEKLREEILNKSMKIASDPSFEAQSVINNNFQIVGLLMQIEGLQRSSMLAMEKLGPDQGPLCLARVGHSKMLERYKQENDLAWDGERWVKKGQV
ncbi:hypothetical protein Q9X98_004770 [Vibrio parahaemolyticus]|nr:hypothetical protein [Vibrio parahaemolyticus]